MLGAWAKKKTPELKKFEEFPLPQLVLKVCHWSYWANSYNIYSANSYSPFKIILSIIFFFLIVWISWASSFFCHFLTFNTLRRAKIFWDANFPRLFTGDPWGSTPANLQIMQLSMTLHKLEKCKLKFVGSLIHKRTLRHISVYLLSINNSQH